jgi:hypothetical protein
MNPLLMPLVLVQGRRARSNTPMLPPAAGPTSGAVGHASDPLLRLAVLGESTAAGCGVTTHNEGFAAAFAAELSSRSGRHVTWQTVGQHGATAKRIRHRLLPQTESPLDRAVLLAGVNDVLSRRKPTEWGEDLTAIIDGLSSRAARITVVGIPPFRNFRPYPRPCAGTWPRKQLRLMRCRSEFARPEHRSHGSARLALKTGRLGFSLRTVFIHRPPDTAVGPKLWQGTDRSPKGLGPARPPLLMLPRPDLIGTYEALALRHPRLVDFRTDLPWSHNPRDVRRSGETTVLSFSEVVCTRSRGIPG